MDITKMKSHIPLTPYAPSWDISIGTEMWNDKDKIEKILEFLLVKEKEVLTLPPESVGVTESTRLGERDVTTRYGRYNLFDYANELPEINDLLEFLQRAYIEYVKRDFLQPRALTIVCWYNIIRQGQEIGKHQHGSNPHTFLSGNMQLTDSNSGTYYVVPYENNKVYLEAIKGRLSIFPSCIMHGVNEHKENSLRISLAFDLHYTEYRANFPELSQRNFMDEQIFRRLQGA